jgi:hypothetical protein
MYLGTSTYCGSDEVAGYKVLYTLIALSEPLVVRRMIKYLSSFILQRYKKFLVYLIFIIKNIMSTSRPFAYNPGSPINGTIQIGDLAIGIPTEGFTSSPQFWNGPDEELGYVIAVPVPDNTQPTPISGVFASVKFLGTKVYPNPNNESTFLSLVNLYFNQNFTVGYDASFWLFNNGYWTNYPSYPPISNIDANNYATKVVAAGGIINSTTASALNTLFDALQNNYTEAGPSFYSVLEGFYPILGTTAATQAINANGNTSYDLQFSGGWGFGSLGMQGNGINTYAYTGKDYIPITTEELWNTHFSIYGTVYNLVNLPYKADLSVGGGKRYVSITLTNGRYEYECGSGAEAMNASSANFVTISCSNANTYSYQNGYTTGIFAGTVPYLQSTQSLYLGLGTFETGCQTNAGSSENTYGWASFGGFMSLVDMGNYQTIVNTFMTSIGRSTY